MKIFKWDIYKIAILFLSISLTGIHINSIMYVTDIQNYNFQIDLANGLVPSSYDMQIRILFPKIVQFMSTILPKLPHVYHQNLSLALAELVTVIFCLFGLFILSKEILRAKLKSFIVVVFYSIYLPYIFQMTHRYGEAFIPGFFCFLFYSVIAKRQRLFVLMLILCSFQRIDIAYTAVFFKILYDYRFYGKRVKTAFFNSLFLLIPGFVFLTLINIYNLHTVKGYLNTASQYILGNMTVVPIILCYYFPVFVLSIARFKHFDKKIYYILAGLIPYFLILFWAGSFNETRLLHPFVITLLIGIASSVNNSDIKGFVNSELGP